MLRGVLINNKNNTVGVGSTPEAGRIVQQLVGLSRHRGRRVKIGIRGDGIRGGKYVVTEYVGGKYVVMEYVGEKYMVTEYVGEKYVVTEYGGGDSYT